MTGALHRPAFVLLGRLDDADRLQYAGRNMQLARQAGEHLGALLAPAPAGSPSQRWTFSAAWGSREKLDVRLVSMSHVVEVRADVAFDSSGRWRHLVRLLRVRADMAPGDVPRAGG
ncbi:hypothetical protein [Streptomyces sp. NBC_01497]|uniref:hypothetical protein n=1 Tax=Streptomyces sp. NBC_01497 TaxID=2903885 RepID=UPI002E31F4A6|nr:hypothetical protein [Streptomyces sp. NBC_01497]